MANVSAAMRSRPASPAIHQHGHERAATKVEARIWAHR